MKKLLAALAIAGLWFVSSHSSNSFQTPESIEVEMQALKTVDPEVGKFRNQKLSGFYANELKMRNKDHMASLNRMTRELTRIHQAIPSVDQNIGPRVIELSNAISKAQEQASSNMNELLQYMTVKPAGKDKIN